MKFGPHAVINLASVRHNYQIAKSLFSGKVMAVIKSDAYGHGMLAVAQALHEADAFAVARLHDAITLRSHGIKTRILVLSGASSQVEIDLHFEHRLDLCVHDLEVMTALEVVAQPNKINVWLKVDTGMHRMGLAPEQFANAYQRLQALPCVDELIVMTHLAQSGSVHNAMTTKQLDLFFSLPGILEHELSVASSSMILHQHPLLTKTHWARAGLLLYGLSPGEHELPESIKLHSAMCLKAPIIHIKQVLPGDSIGYGGHYTVTKAMVLGVVACGYGDGFPREIAPGTEAFIDEQPCEIIGRVSMDLLSIEITNVANVRKGSLVTLLGDSQTATVLANQAGTISYQLLTNIGHKVPKIYQNQSD